MKLLAFCLIVLSSWGVVSSYVDSADFNVSGGLHCKSNPNATFRLDIYEGHNPIVWTTVKATNGYVAYSMSDHCRRAEWEPVCALRLSIVHDCPDYILPDSPANYGVCLDLERFPNIPGSYKGFTEDLPTTKHLVKCF